MKANMIYLCIISILLIGCNEKKEEISSISPELLARADSLRIRLDMQEFEKEVAEGNSRYYYYYQNDENEYFHYAGNRSGIPYHIHNDNIYYCKEVMSEDCLYMHKYIFFSDGTLRKRSTGFYGKGNSDFPIGLTVTYDKNGNILSIHDEDEEYPAPLQGIIDFMEKEELSFFSHLYRINGCYVYSDYWHAFKIDGKTGKILLYIHRSAPQCGNYKRTSSLG